MHNLCPKNYAETAFELGKIAYMGGTFLPPVNPGLRLLSDADLCALVEQRYRTHMTCHTQSTERAVKLTTESTVAVSGANRQDGYSHSKVTYHQRFCQK